MPDSLLLSCLLDGEAYDGTDELKGAPYLSASDIEVIVPSIPDPGLRAKIKPGSKSGRAYTYTWDTAKK